jgi:K+-sensing histidine kinase KdpD
MEEIADSARARKINLDYKTVTSLPALNSNRQAIKESLVHLLQHMMGKSNEGSRVRVETIVSNGLVRIGVSSNTAQMSDDDITDMFAGFIEGKHKEETYPEKLSLFLVRSNVERLGGVIWPERMADGGVVAYFTLPIA